MSWMTRSDAARKTGLLFFVGGATLSSVVPGRARSARYLRERGNLLSVIRAFRRSSATARSKATYAKSRSAVSAVTRSLRAASDGSAMPLSIAVRVQQPAQLQFDGAISPLSPTALRCRHLPGRTSSRVAILSKGATLRRTIDRNHVALLRQWCRQDFAS
jgi:hypothetical protein